MSSASKVDQKPIESKRELIEWFEGGNTPNEKRLIGVEHEKAPFYLADNKPVPFVGENGRAGISDFIAKMVTDKGWSPAAPENGIVLSVEKDNSNWTFEPAGQMELGGAPLRNVHQNAEETDRTIKEAVEVTSQLGYGMLAMGFHPTHLSKDLPLMPKSRYQALFSWFAEKKFPTAADVASSTSTVQVNLGYQSEADMVKMLRVSLSLQPIAVSMFATSPFEEGELSGYQSTRSHKLYKSMGGRYGFMLPIAFDEGFGFEMFTDYALNTMPMLGVYKGTTFLDAKGAMFQDFIDGELGILPGQKASIGDWQNHLNTIWPEVRLRRFLEMRGTDVGPQEMIKALPAFWVGLLYDKQSLDAAYEMVKDWDDQDRDYLRVMTPETGLQTKFLNTTVQEIAKNALALSEAGLKRRAVLNAQGQDESMYLEPLKEIVESGRNWAIRLEEKFKGEWNGDINRAFTEMSYANNPSVLKANNGLSVAANANTVAVAPKKLVLPGDKDFKMPKQ